MLRRMLHKARPRSAYDVMAAIGCFAALATGSAYAANTIGSTDIIDGQVKSVDVGDGEVKAADVGSNAVDSARVRDNTLNTFDVHSFLGVDIVDGTITGDDIAHETITAPDIGVAAIADYNLSPNIITGSNLVAPGVLTGDDVLNGSLTGFDIAEESIGGNDIDDNTIGGADIADGSLGNFDILDNNLLSADIQDGTLTSADINESTLDLSSATTTALGFVNHTVLTGRGGVFVNVMSKTLPPGFWAIDATVSTEVSSGEIGDNTDDATCELRAQNGTILGEATDRRSTPAGQVGRRSLAMNGRIAIPPGGAQVILWCRSTADFREDITYGQAMFIRTGSFS